VAGLMAFSVGLCFFWLIFGRRWGLSPPQGSPERPPGGGAPTIAESRCATKGNPATTPDRPTWREAPLPATEGDQPPGIPLAVRRRRSEVGLKSSGNRKNVRYKNLLGFQRVRKTWGACRRVVALSEAVPPLFMGRGGGFGAF